MQLTIVKHNLYLLWKIYSMYANSFLIYYSKLSPQPIRTYTPYMIFIDKALDSLEYFSHWCQGCKQVLSQRKVTKMVLFGRSTQMVLACSNIDFLNGLKLLMGRLILGYGCNAKIYIRRYFLTLGIILRNWPSFH